MALPLLLLLALAPLALSPPTTAVGVNLLQVSNTTFVPLLPAGSGKVGFRWTVGKTGVALRALAADGSTLWQANVSHPVRGIASIPPTPVPPHPRVLAPEV